MDGTGAARRSDWGVTRASADGDRTEGKVAIGEVGVVDDYVHGRALLIGVIKRYDDVVTDLAPEVLDGDGADRILVHQDRVVGLAILEHPQIRLRQIGGGRVELEAGLGVARVVARWVGRPHVRDQLTRILQQGLDLGD